MANDWSNGTQWAADGQGQGPDADAAEDSHSAATAAKFLVVLLALTIPNLPTRPCPEPKQNSGEIQFEYGSFGSLSKSGQLRFNPSALLCAG